MQVFNGAILQYQGQWEASSGTLLGGGLGAQNANDVLSKVVAALAKDGLTVKSSSSNAGFFQSHSLPFFGASQAPFTVTLTLEVNNGVGFDSEDNVISIIDHEVYIVTGQFPTADTIPTVQNPNTVPVSTGQPSVNASQPPVSFLDGLKQLFSNTKLVFAGVGLGLVVAVLMITQSQKRRR